MLRIAAEVFPRGFAQSDHYHCYRLLNEAITVPCFKAWTTKEISLNHNAVFSSVALSYFH